MNVNKLFAFYLIINIILRLFLWSEIKYIFGTDTGRFAEISHIFYLKGKITPDLRPYNMAYGFFYFLLPILMSTVLEYIGIDSITSMTFFVFLFSVLSCVVFYFIMKQFFDKKKAAHMFFFYSIAFDITLTFGIAGIYPYALSVLWFFLSIYFTNKIFFNHSKSWIYLGIVFVLFSMTHTYLFFPLLCYIFSLITYELIKENSLSRTFFMFKNIAKSMIFPIFANIPVFLVFGKYFNLSFNAANKGLIMTASFYRENLSFFDRLFYIFSSSYTLVSSVILVIGLIFFIISVLMLRKKQIIWVFYTIYLFVHNFFVFNNLNMSRLVSALWLSYSIGMGSILTVPLLNAFLMGLFYYIPSPTVSYYINVLKQTEIDNKNIYPWVIWNDFYKAIGFIKTNTSSDSVFLIDSGGAGCFGSSSSYGDRIFPLTSRRPFYFTDYCWAVWDLDDYENRVNLYREISINPNNDTLINNLKEYNVTHVFIGPYDVGLNYTLFKNSKHYEEMFNENRFSIFKIK